MAKDIDKRWRCRACDTITLEPDLLRGPNPFDSEDILCGCPVCHEVNEFDEICDEPNCESIASCGFPTQEGDQWDGYRGTCYEHSPYKRRPDPQPEPRN